jgi:hypothetical protein
MTSSTLGEGTNLPGSIMAGALSAGCLATSFLAAFFLAAFFLASFVSTPSLISWKKRIGFHFWSTTFHKPKME